MEGHGQGSGSLEEEVSEDAKKPTEKELLDALKGEAKPELQRIADETRKKFLADMSVLDTVDSGRLDKLDGLLKEAGDYYIKSVTLPDPDEAQQWADAADARMRSVAQLVIAEKIVASRTAAAMLQQAALAVWNGFKTVAGGVLSVAVKALIAGVLPGIGGAIGGAVADAVADTFRSDDAPSA